MNKKKISLISCATIGLSAIVVATPLLVTSCSDIKPIESPNTENITTFADAINFTNKFFKENYTFDMLKKDLQNYASNFSSTVSNDEFQETLTINPSLNGDKLNLAVNMKSIATLEGQKATQTNNIEFTNFKITPVLVKQNDGTFVAKIAFKAEWASVQGTSYDSLNALKSANSDWETKTIAHENISASIPLPEDFSNDRWVLLDTTINSNKEYTEADGASPLGDISFITSKYVTIEFKNIK